VTNFNIGDRVYHRPLDRYGVYQGRHNWGNPVTSPETSSYVWFDGDPEDEPVPVTTAVLVAESEVAR
jgi:hypothetical protein